MIMILSTKLSCLPLKKEADVDSGVIPEPFPGMKQFNGTVARVSTRLKEVCFKFKISKTNAMALTTNTDLSAHSKLVRRFL